MKILAIAALYPWPAVDGYRQRLDHVLRGLAGAGAVDLFCLHRPGQPEPEPPPEDGPARVVVHHAGADLGAREWTARWSRSELPRRLLIADWSGAREELAAWEPRPDVIWYSLVDTWAATHDLFEGVPAICDFDNLENLAIRLRRRVAPSASPGATASQRLRGGARWMASRSVDLVDERRWDRVQRAAAADVDRVVVCSPLDVDRSGVSNAVAVPNGADRPVDVRTDRRHLVGDAPVMLFVGALDYEPNAEAVGWMVRDVLPLIRARRPDAVLRIVGRGAGSVAWAADEPGVDLVGEVPEVRPELDRADVSVVPIRVGAGTRLKVVEALAHRLPLVSTTVGCEGIEVVDGTHALVADDARRFADGCLRLLSDGELRQRLADAGAELFERRYTWDAIGAEIAELVREVAGAPSTH